MKYTDNYGLKKPELNDYVEIDDLNENADIIDEKLKDLEDNVKMSVQDGIINGKTTDMTYLQIMGVL